MKTKHKFSYGLAAILLAGVLTLGLGCGCKSTSVDLGVTTAQTDTNGVLSIGGTVVQPAAAGVAIKLGAKYGAQALLRDNPDSRQYLGIAAGVIDVAIANQNYDPVALQASLQQALQGSGTGNAQVIAAAISDGLDLYKIFYSQTVNAKVNNVSPYLAPCLQGLADGITLALAVTVPLPPTTP